MKIRNLLWFSLTVLATLSLFTVAVPSGRGMTPENPYTMSAMEMMPDTIPPVKPREGDFITGDDGNPFDLKDPPAINQSVEYDPATGLYIVMEKVGDDYYRTPTYMTFEEYQNWMAEKEQKEYFHELVTASNASAGEDPITPYKSSIQDGLMDRLFGPGGVDIRPQGNIDLTFGGDYQKVENPILPARLQRQGGFNFDMNIQLNVVGKIGKRLKLTTNYNTQATFDFDNQIKLEFSSDDVYTEDGILKKIEAGNVSLPLKSSLIQGTQSLFGIKTQLQFGKLMTTLVVSQQQSRRNEINIQGGSQTQSFSVNADAYDENRHYFLTHYNRNNYERSLQNMPQVNSLFHVTRIEVWATNTNNRSTERLRSIMALADIGEADAATLNNPSAVSVNSTAPRDLSNKPLPDNESNNLYQRIKSNRNARNTVSSGSTLSSTYRLEGARDFVQVNARKLSTSEYTFQPDLGMLSLNAQINPGDVVGVAFQYLYNGKTYQVGEFAQDLPPGTDSLSVLFVKMLKSTTPNVKFPIWDLMMKNVYSLNAFQINPQDFRLDIAYQDPGGGEKRFLPDGPAEGTPLLNILNLDKLNRSNDPYPDGQFDFVPGLTILPQNGKIIFPKLEPFGSSLIPALSTGGVPDAAAVNKYVYQQLYDSTVTKARFYPEYNRFVIRGSFKSSSSSDISLGAFNIPRNSVRVTSGGRQLAEGTDYTIDYSLGRIKILDPSLIESGSPIKVSFEDNSVLGFQTKSLMGARFDYLVNKDLTIGGTFMRLSERPFTQKVNIGDDPILNNVLGLDAQYSKDAPWLTKLLDKLPFFSTKTMSKIQFSGEVAVLKPGHPKVIDQGSGAGGTVYLDDFEGSAARTPLGLPANSWVLASVPQDDGTGANPRFPEAKLLNDYRYGANRAALSWYNLDPIFARGQVTEVPVNSLPTDEMAYIREIDRRDIFPAFGGFGQQQNTLIRTFDLAFNPERRGPYNFDAEPRPGFTAGVDPASGGLLNPKSRWGGIMRRLDNTDFEAANIEYVEFWVMSPFKNGQNVDGADLYIELGNLSEDILRDGQRSVENGLPGPNGNVPIISTGWAQIPQTQIITNAFDNDPAVRTLQDVGLDGKTDTLERNTGYSSDYLTRLSARLTGGVANPAYARAEADPSADNFKYYLDETLNNVPLPESIFDNPVINHYSVFNGTEGNSQPNAGGDIVTSSTNLPDDEDVVKDNTLQNRDRESYFQYKVPLRPSTNGEMLTSNSTFFTSAVENTYTVASGTDNVTWYQVKIPVDQFTEKIGDLDLRNIQFIRMYLTNASEQIVLRLAEFSLVRNQWRRYSRSLKQPGIIIPGDVANNTTFDVNQVSIEENGSRLPFNYILPPGVQREQLVGSIAANARQNEQALSLRLCNLQDGDARGIFKNLNLDMRVYKRLKMFVHAEPFPADQIINPGEVTCFLRLGSDFEKNYYEYEIPLTMSTTGVQTAENVWLPENTFDFPLELLRQAKVLRNSINGNLNTPFVLPTGDPDLPSAKISVIGNPDLGLVESVMIGIRNPLSSDGQSQCLEVWVNELRLTGFDEQGGIAALGRLDVTLADLGTLNFSGSYKGIGWGAIDQKVQQRSREAVATYGSAMRLDLDKFLPKQWGIKLPFLVQIDNEIRTPQYDPYQLDIKLRDRLNAATDATERAKIRQEALSIHNITSFNFTNVRKERNPKSTRKPMPWDIANFSVGYSYKRDYLRTPLIAGATMLIQEGNLNYTYAGQGKPIMPFSKLIKKGTYLKWLKEFNFNLLPSSLTFTNNLLRRYGQTQYRFAGDNSTFFEKQFLWDRNYGLNWDLTKSLRLTFNAVNNSLVDETNFGPPVRDEVMRGLQKGGRNKNYTQNVALSYQAPFKLLPITDWIDVKAQYSATFGWSAAALNTDSLGNVIRNTQSRQINGDFNFSNLYNKVKYLKAINTPPVEGKGKNNKENAAQGVGGDDGNGKGGGGKGIKDNTKTKVTKEAAADAGKNKDNKSADGKGKDGKGADGKSADGKDADGKGSDGKEKKKKERSITFAERALLRPLMAIRKVRFNYTEEMSTIVPGFKPVHRALGQDFTAGTAPGYDFAFGRQVDGAWLDKAASNGWITSNIFLNAQFVQTHTTNYDAQINVEPFRDFKLDIDFKKTIVDNYSEYFKVKDNDSNGAFSHLNPMSIGNYNFTFLSLRTMFADGLFSGKKDSSTFKQFEDNRLIISQRLGRGTHENPADSTDGYTNGYGRYQQDVLIPAFLAAYQGKSAASIFLGDIRKLFPAPNWRLTYNGLTKLKPFSKIFSNFSLTHGYKSTLTVNSFQTNLDFAENPTRTDPTTGSFYAQYNIPDLVISEQFSPLIGIDMKFKNDFTAKMDFKKSRTLALTFIDYQLAETKTTELVMGFGFRLKNKNLIALLSGKKPKKKPSKGGKEVKEDANKPSKGGSLANLGLGEIKPQHDLNFKFDFSFRDDKTFNHRIDQDNNVPTRGSMSYRISPSVDYIINNRLTIRAFFDYTRTVPATSISFPITNAQGGVTVRFSLAQ